MSSELFCRYTAGQNLYVVLWSGGEIWNGSDFVTPDASDWGDYDIPLTEVPIAGAASRYVGDFPAAIEASAIYTVELYLRVGGSPAVDDTVLGELDIVRVATKDHADALAIIGATTAGDSQNAGSAIESFKDFAGNQKVNVPVDNSGNRTGVSYS